MSLEDLVSKYISSAEQALGEILITEVPVNVNAESVRDVVDSAKAYLEDAQYYKEKRRFEVSLTSVAYFEGLLDALRLLGAVSFEWPKEVKKEKRSR